MRKENNQNLNKKIIFIFSRWVFYGTGIYISPLIQGLNRTSSGQADLIRNDKKRKKNNRKEKIDGTKEKMHHILTDINK